MTTVITDVEQLKQDVSELVGPFFDKYNGLDEEIKKREAKIEEVKKEIVELRAARSYLRTIVRNINPDLIPPLHSGRNGNGKKKTESQHIAPETKQAIVVWFQSRRDELNGLNPGGGFRPVDIYTREGFPLKSESAINKVMRDLHDEGILHLDRWIRGLSYPNKPTGKFYKVV